LEGRAPVSESASVAPSVGQTVVRPTTVEEDYLPAKRARNVLLVLAGIGLMVTYVETMVIPAQVQFLMFFDQPPVSTASWILGAYLLVGVVATPIFGKLGDIYGKKRVLETVMVVYAITVSIAGFTPDIGAAFGWNRTQQLYLFIVVRGIQGLGLGMFPLAFAMVRDEFPPYRVGTAQGVISAMFSVGAALGLVGGAYITDNYGWQWSYHTVIPIAIAMVILTFLVLRESRVRLKQPLDIPGAAFLGSALGFTIFGITQGPVWGWSSWTVDSLGGAPIGPATSFLLALVFAVAFVLWEPRAKNPIVSFSRLRQRNIVISNVGGLFVGSAMFFLFVGMIYLVQIPGDGLDQSVLTSGLMAFPSALTMLVLGPFVGRYVSAHGPKSAMIVGFFSVAIGGALLVVFNRSILEMILAPIPVLAGAVCVLIAMTNVVVLSSDRREVGIQTGMNQTFRNIGSSLGPAIAASILTAFTSVFFIQVAPGVTVPVTLPNLFAFQLVFALTAVLGVVGGVMSLALRNFRFTAEGVRVDAQGRPAPTEAAPAPAVAIDARVE
jgi:MFS family permease